MKLGAKQRRLADAKQYLDDYEDVKEDDLALIQ